MGLTVEQLGNGAAFLVHESNTDMRILLGCGEYVPVMNTDTPAGKDVSEDDAPRGRKRKHYLQVLMDLCQRNSKNIDSCVDAVLITDYRPTACSMLPYLTEKCISSKDNLRPKVFLTHGTRHIAPKILAQIRKAEKSQKDNASANSSVNLYEAQDAVQSFQNATPVHIREAIPISDHVTITAFHSGHVAGGCCFLIQFDSLSFLYVNGFSMTGGSMLLPASLPRLYPDILLTASRFAVCISETKNGMGIDLIRAIFESLQANGKVIIPVQRVGFVQELMTIVYQYWKRLNLMHIPVYVTEPEIEYPMQAVGLLGNKSLTSAYQTILKEFRHQSLSEDSTSKPFFQQIFDWQLLKEAPSSFVVFTTPASADEGNTSKLVKAYANDPRNLIILCEGCNAGSVNYSLYADPQRAKASKKLGIEIACGIHYFPCGDEVDAKSIVDMAQVVAPRHILLNSTNTHDGEFLSAYLARQIEKNPYSKDKLRVESLSPHGPTQIKLVPKAIPLRIHKSLLHNAQGIHGLLIAESKRKIMLLSTGNGIRRLKKPKHNLQFSSCWKYRPEKVTHKRKKTTRAASSGISFLLSASAGSDEELYEPTSPQANVMELLDIILQSYTIWLNDVKMEQKNLWIRAKSVEISVTIDWQVCINWSYNDEELAGQMFSIAKQCVRQESVKVSGL